MIFIKYIVFIIHLQILLINSSVVELELDPPNSAFDQNFYEDAIDPELCEEHLDYIQRNNSALLLQFLDAGIRIPKGILVGNNVDLGNYYQCLRINHQLEESEIQGKYCFIELPLAQNIKIPVTNGMTFTDFDLNAFNFDEELIEIMERYNLVYTGTKALSGISPNETLSRLMPDSMLRNMQFRVAVCIPKSCSTKQALTSLAGNQLEFREEFCRLPDDKPFVPGDYIAIILFSLLGFLGILGTCYELVHTFVLKKDPKSANEVYKAFSLYTNGRSLMTFSSKPGAIECLDGIRALAMLWVMIGHSVAAEPYRANPLDAYEWQTSFASLWVTAAPITVDTFFTLSGLLVVYTTAGKLSTMNLIKNLHMFYLHRLLRMFPLLAAVVLLHATIYNHLWDGPDWRSVAGEVNKCRAYWWSTLLHLQNYLNPNEICIGVAWYLGIDVSLHIISPAVLLLVLTGKRNIAWAGLVGALLTNLTAATTYNFIHEFPSGMLNPNRAVDMGDYMRFYYTNILTRAPPFFVGMVIGYTLHLYSKKKLKMSKVQVFSLWVCTLATFAFVIYATLPIMQLDWDKDKQTLDSLYNSYIRSIWAVSLGFMIFACHHGYGGPINWFLSLQFWKLPSRLSYAMYVVHMGLLMLVSASAQTTTYFTPAGSFYRFFSHLSLTIFVSFVLSLFVEGPFNNIVKMILGSGFKKAEPKKTTVIEEETTQNGVKL